MNITPIETINAILRYTLGLEVLTGCASVALFLPGIYEGFHVLAWYKRKKREVAKRSHTHTV